MVLTINKNNPEPLNHLTLFCNGKYLSFVLRIYFKKKYFSFVSMFVERVYKPQNKKTKKQLE